MRERGRPSRCERAFSVRNAETSARTSAGIPCDGSSARSATAAWAPSHLCWPVGRGVRAIQRGRETAEDDRQARPRFSLSDAARPPGADLPIELSRRSRRSRSGVSKRRASEQASRAQRGGSASVGRHQQSVAVPCHHTRARPRFTGGRDERDAGIPLMHPAPPGSLSPSARSGGWLEVHTGRYACSRRLLRSTQPA